MPQRNELAMRARNVGLDPSTIPNDSKLEQKVLWLEKNSSAVTGTAAVSTLTSTNTEVTDGDTVTIGPRVYRFKSTPAQVNDIKISNTADTTLGYLVAAINGTATGDGTDCYAGTTENRHVSAGAVGSHATIITARDTNVGGTLATTTTASQLSWTGSTLNAGTPAVAGIVAASGGNETSGSAGGVSGDNNTSI